MKRLFLGASSIALALSAGAAMAQTSPADTVNEVIVTGTRQVGIKAADSAAPIQLVGAQQLYETGSPDLATALTAAVPSLDIQTNGGDAAAVHTLASLRGLSPNDTLILVNGQRRHTTSNLSVDGGSIYSGSATTDLTYIPVGAIDHIEVLTDGAAAQYGSDAIAGVINIILKKNSSGGMATGTGGYNYNGQGATQSLSFNQGFNINDKGFLNLTLEERSHDFTTLGFGDDRFQNANGTLLSTLSPINQNVVNGPNYPHENRVYGDPESSIWNAFFNAAYHVTSDIELYGFGNFSYNASQHFENYRGPTRDGGPSCLAPCTSTADYGLGPVYYAVPNGFDPKENFDETDYSLTVGARGTKFGWNWDVATTYGENSTKIYVLDTSNRTLEPIIQAETVGPLSYPTHTLYDGTFDSTEWDGKLDVDRSFDIGLAGPLNVAMGVEGRKDTFAIGAGEPDSYFGAGSDSFAGYSPADAISTNRTNFAGYLDLATKPIKDLTADVAGRYEHYSDFGDVETGKLTLRYDVSPMLALRGTISSGFRAPTLAEGSYDGINVGPNSVSAQLAPDSALAKASGFSPLKPEESVNYSAGFVLHPFPKLQITADAYYILLHNRILPGSGFTALSAYCVPNNLIASTPHTNDKVVLSCPTGSNTTPLDVLVSPGILNGLNSAGVNTSQLTSVGLSAFINGANTTTGGLDVTATYSSDFEEFGKVDWSLGFNYNHTQITKNTALPNGLYDFSPPPPNGYGLNQTSLTGTDFASELTTAPPREKLILQALWRKGPWSVNLRETVYNDMAEYTFAPSTGGYFLEKIPTTGITDLDIGFKVTKNIKLDAGANNIFNIIPPKTPLSSAGQPIDGAYVYNVPYGFAPWGQNGGYYYIRATLTY
jgi:iron complex outermembrane receptor protein